MTSAEINAQIKKLQAEEKKLETTQNEYQKANMEPKIRETITKLNYAKSYINNSSVQLQQNMGANKETNGKINTLSSSKNHIEGLISILEQALNEIKLKRNEIQKEIINIQYKIRDLQIQLSRISTKVGSNVKAQGNNQTPLYNKSSLKKKSSNSKNIIKK